MLRILVTRAVTGEIVLDTIREERIVNMILSQFQTSKNARKYNVRVMYP